MIEYTNSQIINLINEYIHSERDRLILIDRFVNGYTYQSIAEKYDLSIRQTKNIVYKSEIKIFKHM